MKRIRRGVLAAVVVAMLGGAGSARAQSTDTFSAWDVQLLYGTAFREPDVVGDVSKGLATFENAAGWSWGSSYFFVDCLRSYSAADRNATEVYAEWYPSVSLRNLAGLAPGTGVVRDVSLTLAVNAGTRSTGPQALAYLPGFTFDLSVPGFKLLSVGAYAYVDRSRIGGETFGADGTTFQVTPSWSLPFRLGSAELSFDGFADYIGAHGDLEWQFLTQPQLKLDVAALGGRPGRLFVGVEWQVWRNKYGVRDLHESVPQLLLVWNP